MPTIRAAHAADEPAIRHCAEQAYTQYVESIGRRPAPMDADFAQQIAAGQVFVHSDTSDALQGFVVFFAQGDGLLLENVAVLPTQVGKGIGKALIGFCEQQAQQMGVNTVRLYTNEKMSANLALYPRLGYREVARRSENGFNRVYFEKTLA